MRVFSCGSFVLFFATFHYCWGVIEPTSGNSYQFFGTRTSYSLIKNEERIPDIPGCVAQQLWMLSRPSVSWPREPTFQRLHILHQLRADIVANHQQGRGGLTSEIIKSFEQSDIPPDSAKAGTMTEQGEKDLTDLARTMKSSFPHLFVKPYTKENYEFRYIDSLSSEQSMKNFTKELFGEDFDTSQIHKPAEIDTFLDAPNLCNSWKNEVFPKRWWRLLSSRVLTPFYSMRREISTRLGFKNTLNHESIIIMYLACSMQTAMNPDVNAAWCAPFSTSNLKFLEYLEDRFYYNACTGGQNSILSELNKRMPCLLYEDMIQQFSRVERNRYHSSGVFYFTDENTILLLLHGLDLLSDATINDFGTMNQRTFRTSSLVPYAGNFLAVIYRCSSGEELRLGFYINGKLFKNKQNSEELLSWKKWKKGIQTFALTQMNCYADFCKDMSRDPQDTVMDVFRV